MSRAAFEQLVVTIANLNRIPVRNIPLEKKMLFSLWVLAKPECFLAAGDRFGFASSIAHFIFKEFISTVVHLLPDVIICPHNYMEAVTEFSALSHGFPGVIGAIDGCHLPIKQPLHNANDYLNRKSFYSIILQGICDHNMKYIDIVYVGMPGRVHDARVFRNSQIYNRITNDDVIPDDLHLIGDSAYPIMKNLLTPFRDNGHLTQPESNYNNKLSSTRSIIERAFSRLKGKFRRLKYLDITNPDFGVDIITAACILHNFILTHDNDHEEFQLEENPEEGDEYHEEERANEHGNIGIVKRNNIVQLLRR